MPLYMFLLRLLVSISLAFSISAAPPTLHALPSNSTDPHHPLTINTTITDYADHDITSSFQLKLYLSPPSILTLQNTSGESLIGRQPSLSRPINTCTLSTQYFMSSACNPAPAIQAYTLLCATRSSVWRTPAGRSPVTRRSGRCFNDEICVNSISQRRDMDRFALVPTALCVQQRAFVTWTNPAQRYLNPGIDDAWRRMTGYRNPYDGNTYEPRVHAVMSEADGSTPLEVDTLGLEAGVGGLVNQTASCRDCVELQTERLSKETDSLKTEAKLLTTGAALGIVWLAVMSG